MVGEIKVVDVSQIKPGSLMMIDGAPCKVVSVDVSRPGKHGHAKFRIVAVGIIDEKKRDIVMPHASVEVPVIGKREAQVLSVTGDMANIMDSETFETLDLKIPDELKDKVKSGVTIIYWEIVEAKIMKQVKE
jgi:translation initiation factor 5A